jgi:hypothetical protein
MASDDEMKRVSEEVAARLEALGIALDGREQPEELAAIEEAVERFEEAVESRGGDLMVDEGDRARASEPDDPHFALPVRRPGESVAAYLDRLAHATEVVLRHPIVD